MQRGSNLILEALQDCTIILLVLDDAEWVPGMKEYGVKNRGPS